MLFPRVGKRIVAAMLAGLLSGCVFSRVAQNDQVVERSKEQRPPWVEKAPGQVFLNGATLSFALERKHLLDLPLGLAQTQLAALEESSQGLTQYLIARAEAAGQPAGSTLDGTSQAALKDACRAVVANLSVKDRQVADIYFEKILHDPPLNGSIEDSYDVYVLITWAEGTAALLNQKLGEKLRSSPLSGLQALAKSLLATSAPITRP